MLTEFHGLPTHVLLVHVVVAGVPLAALLTVLHATWPAARRRLGAVTPLVALVALISVPITTHAGEWLKKHLQAGGPVEQRIDHHAALGRTLLPLVIVLFVVSVGVWWLGRRFEFGVVPDRRQSGTVGHTALPRWAAIVIAVVTVVVAVVNVVQLYRIGDAGAQAVWSGVVSKG